MSSRRDFLKRLGIGLGGAAVLPIPGTALADDKPSDIQRDGGHRSRSTDEAYPKQDYGLMVDSDSYERNPDLLRLRGNGTCADRDGYTNVYVRAWIDEEVYGIRNSDGTINTANQEILSRAFAECVWRCDGIMAPVLGILRRNALTRKALQAGVPVNRSLE